MKRVTKWSLLAAGVVVIGLSIMGCASIVDATVSSAPAKTVYGQGQELDVAGMVVTTTDSKGKTKDERITAATRVTGFDSHRTGKQTLSIAMGFTGKVKATFEVNVMPLESITVSTPPAKIMYKQGEDFDTSGLSIRGTWAEIGEDEIPASGYTVSGYDKGNAGDQTVTITAEGKTADLSVSVVALASITIAAQPTKIKYNQGEEFDTAGLRVRGNWPGIGESDIPASGYTVSGYDKNKAGNQAVAITSEGKSASVNVQVLQLVALAVTAQPAKTKYFTGEALDLTELVINGTFMDGRNPVQVPVIPANTTVSGFDSAFVGQQRVTLTIGTISTSFNVTVEQAPAPVAPPPTAAAAPVISSGNGTSKEDAILLTPGKWADGTISASGAIWYKFPVVANQRYWMWWNGSTSSRGDGTKTGDVMGTVFTADGRQLISGEDRHYYGWFAPAGYFPSSNGICYLLIEPYSGRNGGGNPGTFGVAFVATNQDVSQSTAPRPAR
ncbi:hypothetical protein FACS189461_1190 [Spirochaetia bacterium]|nr:hypothetical protein FACS189461_1190 [Spirochaetia bacterium]